MIFSWLRKRRRQKLLRTPATSEWLTHLGRVGHYHLLLANDQAKLLDAARIFVAEKTFEGCKGLEVTEEMQAVIAALACVLVLGLDDYYFDNVHTILVYPTGFAAPQQLPLAGDVALEHEADHLGEAHYRGPIILSWDEVERDAADPGKGFNLVFHEFAHQIDMLNGAADGVPPLPRHLRQRWQDIMAREYKRLCRAADHGRETLIDPYGASEPAEFFAVVSEAFFDMPRDLKIEHPELYSLFQEYYRQDPAGWRWPELLHYPGDQSR